MEITVPFCPKSKLSGIEYKNFMSKVMYRREFEIKQTYLQKKVVLHFGAVDYEAKLYINKIYVGLHSGGYVPFSFDITDYINVGVNTIDLVVEDDTTSYEYPSGKQSYHKDSFACYYTRTTGIWQTVWLEFLEETHLKYCHFNTDIDNNVLMIKGECSGEGKLRVEIHDKGVLFEISEFDISGHFINNIKISKQIELWDVQNPKP